METSFTSPSHLDPIPEHELPPPRPPRAYGIMKVVAALAILLSGLGLIFLGGCFLIGVMELLRQMAVTPEMADNARFLVNTLYVLAFTCFGAAAILLLLGVWSLLRVIGERFVSK